ncbi:uncharacterized protein N0V89_001480 [Didymosphaeria variabile]|uniref:Transcription factor domain-containing protein n=1 Tax=Didymosphaeria variabile TaxID=1932322 RepID=A0A9W8XXB9_9PLEO|nr:uncharacterized protein N0V89_001480 [Didymosphaeria variabile]KAJ4360911.1 hypothetical protein N0V89_001480 [Didymosphaeria variabile]
MLKYARILDARRSTLESIYVITDAEAAWTIWCQEERLNRLTYAWVVLDQEINLFYDNPLDLDVNELNSYLPTSEKLWTATSAETWLATYLELLKTNEAQTGSQEHGTSLAMLFKRFINGELSRAEDISQLELRLLLHPIQALIYHLYKSFSHCFSSNSQRHLQRFLTQVEEVQYLLKQWGAVIWFYIT